MEKKGKSTKKASTSKKQVSKKAKSKGSGAKDIVKSFKQIIEEENAKTLLQYQIETMLKKEKVTTKALKKIQKAMDDLSVEKLKEVRDELEKGL